MNVNRDIYLYVFLVPVVEALISSDPLSEAGARFQAIDLLFVPDSDSNPANNQPSPLHNCIMQVRSKVCALR